MTTHSASEKSVMKDSLSQQDDSNKIEKTLRCGRAHDKKHFSIGKKVAIRLLDEK